MAEQGSLLGHILGQKYRLGKLLGQGGFGVVYEAQHLLLHRSQAIKLLLDRFLQQPKFRERFLREARLLAALDHPHIVHIDDFGFEEQTELAYLVMPFISGGTFAAILRMLKERQQFMELHQIVAYLEQISSALDYIHQQQVMHLDLKPENLLVSEEGKILLADFGLAHVLTQEEEDISDSISLQNGTPHYMAPEHIKGHPKLQSDVYALGVILYQMLVGQRPFEGTVREVWEKQVAEQAPPLRSWRPELPAALEGVVEKALAKEVAQRYQSAGELLVDLKAALAIPPQHIAQEKAEEKRGVATVTMTTVREAGERALPPQTREGTEKPTKSLALPPETKKAVKASPLSRVLLLGLVGLLIVALSSGGAWLAFHPTSSARSLTTTRGITPSATRSITPSTTVTTSPTVTISPTVSASPAATPSRGVAPAGEITEFQPLPTSLSFPAEITMGPDGNLWFTEATNNKIGRLSPNGGTLAEFSFSQFGNVSYGITAGPDGNLWFTEAATNKIGRLSPNGALTEFSLPTLNSRPGWITTGPDHNLWFTDGQNNAIGCLHPDGIPCGEFPISTSNSLPDEITVGPDNNLWFTESNGNNIGRLTLATGKINEFPVRTTSSLLRGITKGPDGNLWFTEASGNNIGVISPAGQVLHEFPLASSTGPVGIATGPDNNLWIVESNSNKIGRMNPTGKMLNEYLLPTQGSVPVLITVGPDHKLYFTESLGNKIGCITSGA